MIAKILSSLPDSYKYFKSAWDSTSKEERTLENLTARLLKEEMGKNQNTTEAIFKTAERSDKLCFICKKPGHIAKFCKNSKPSCKICKKANHTAENCWKKEKRCNICKKFNHTMLF